MSSSAPPPPPHPPASSQSGRAIVVLSDGTGNSAAKLFKTNVWRLYEGLDLSSGDQIALYDDGVGTSSFLPLALLGGAFGWGLKRNVLGLYRFLCAHYRPGDRIYAFGFSRGAFTIRVLVGLIANRGLIAGAPAHDLPRLAAWAYRHYRRRYNTTGGLVDPLRTVRDVVWSAWDRLRGRPAYASVARHEAVDVRFVGLWDTVDAYGMPIDEVLDGLDQWVWPMSFTDLKLSPIVQRACHALSLDDERNTFHPVLWDESDQPPAAHLDDERISQVWFAGMHSNVGGGYPDDGLAYVSLDWMARQAETCGLRFTVPASMQWAGRARECAPMADSRRGVGGYYRYNPRRLERVGQPAFARIALNPPKIHESVFRRIRDGCDGYAPLVLPRDYAVVTSRGNVLSGPANPYEHPTQAAARAARHEAAWDLVWRKRVVYFATVAASVGLLALPFVAGGADEPAAAETRLLSKALRLAGAYAPAVVSPLVEYYANRPWTLTLLGLIIAGLLSWGSRLQHGIFETMRGLWLPTVTAPPHVVDEAGPYRSRTHALRTHRLYTGAFRLLSKHIVPGAIGLSTLAAIFWLALVAPNRLAFEVTSAIGQVCRDDPQARGLEAVGPAAWRPASVRFDNQAFCQSSGVRVTAGERYRLRVSWPAGTGSWRDDTIAVPGPQGFTSAEAPWVFVPALPLRRVLGVPWFVPIARVGARGGEHHALRAADSEFVARGDGVLYLFVNDAIGPFWDWSRFYRNNQGARLLVTIERVR